MYNAHLVACDGYKEALANLIRATMIEMQVSSVVIGSDLAATMSVDRFAEEMANKLDIAPLSLAQFQFIFVDQRKAIW